MASRHILRASPAFLIAGTLAMGCSHAWDVLEPLPGAGGAGGSTSSSAGTRGVGGASATSTTSTAQGPGSTSSAGGATSTAQGSGGATSTSDASSSSATSGPGGGATANYGATFAACNSNLDLNLQNCEALAGPDGMYTDVLSTTGFPMHAYVRFDLDAQLVGKTIDAVTLRLTTLPDNAANSVSSGEIWRVMPFDAASLTMGQPATIGGVIGADLGVVDFAKDYYWGLPTSLVAANSPVFLGVISTSDDGVRYWNQHGMTPPLLLVNYH